MACSRARLKVTTYSCSTTGLKPSPTRDNQVLLQIHLKIMLVSSSSSTTASSSSPSEALAREDTHTVTLLEEDDTAGVDPASSPPSSSPVVMTPPDCSEGGASLSFFARLNDLLLAAQAQEEQDASPRSAASPGNQIYRASTLGSTGVVYTEATSLSLSSDSSRKRARSGNPSDGTECPIPHAHRSPTTHKRRKLSQDCSHPPTRGSRSTQPLSATRLSGAFRLQYARGPGSLRRAESLRSHVSIQEEEEVLNEVSGENYPSP